MTLSTKAVFKHKADASASQLKNKILSAASYLREFHFTLDQSKSLSKSFRKAGRKLNTVITGSPVISLGLKHTKAAVCKPQPQSMPGSFAKQSALMSPCSLECSLAKTSWYPLSFALQGRRSKEQFLQVFCQLH